MRQSIKDKRKKNRSDEMKSRFSDTFSYKIDSGFSKQSYSGGFKSEKKAKEWYDKHGIFLEETFGIKLILVSGESYVNKGKEDKDINNTNN